MITIDFAGFGTLRSLPCLTPLCSVQSYYSGQTEKYSVRAFPKLLPAVATSHILGTLYEILTPPKKGKFIKNKSYN